MGKSKLTHIATVTLASYAATITAIALTLPLILNDHPTPTIKWVTIIAGTAYLSICFTVAMKTRNK